MTWDSITEYTSAFIATLLLFLSLIFVPEIRRSKKRRVVVFLLIAITFFLAIHKTNSEKTEDAQQRLERVALTDTISLVRKTNGQILEKIVLDSLNDAVFQKRLFKEFQITRDSITNKPVKVQYNIQVTKARDLYIGDNR